MNQGEWGVAVPTPWDLETMTGMTYALNDSYSGAVVLGFRV
jgi:hypothetical protein